MINTDTALLKVQLYLQLMKIPPDDLTEPEVELLFTLARDHDIRAKLEQGLTL